MTSPDPLKQLLVDPNKLDRERLVDALTGIAGIAHEDGELVPLSGFDSLKGNYKVLVALLVALAAKKLGLKDSDMVSSSQIVGQTGLPAGTVRRALAELRSERLITVSTDKKYSIVPAQVNQALTRLERVTGGPDD